ncbi:MAG: DUF4292 domain-containing protein [Owenweeksia sp.]|nr:DUF4292 domain-containing protein [Owenweeksia sp.]
MARAIIYKDSLVYVNRMDKQYFTGQVAELQDQFNLQFGFRELQNIFGANLLFDLRENFKIYYTSRPLLAV